MTTIKDKEKVNSKLRITKILENNKLEAKIKVTVEFPSTILTSLPKLSKFLSLKTTSELKKWLSKDQPQLFKENQGFRRMKRPKD